MTSLWFKQIAPALIDRFHKLYSPWKIALVASGMWTETDPLFALSGQLGSFACRPRLSPGSELVVRYITTLLLGVEIGTLRTLVLSHLGHNSSSSFTDTLHSNVVSPDESCSRITPRRAVRYVPLCILATGGEVNTRGSNFSRDPGARDGEENADRHGAARGAMAKGTTPPMPYASVVALRQTMREAVRTPSTNGVRCLGIRKRKVVDRGW